MVKKLCYMDTDSFSVNRWKHENMKTDGIYKDIA